MKKISMIQIKKMFDTELMKNVVVFSFIKEGEEVVNTIVHDYRRSKDMMLGWIQEMLDHETDNRD